ncbi:MAG: hypothetical protein RL026_1191 [Pseudomonadota bacterium]
MKPYKTSSLDIAALAKVSQATVSRALRNSPQVRPETRARILQIARDLNYKTDRSAAGLRTGRSNTLALLLFEETPNEAQVNPFFLTMLGQITQAAARRGYDLLVSFQQFSEDFHTDYEVSRRADGLILLGYGDYLTYATRLQRLADSGAHFVLWGPALEDQPGHFVACDNFAGARMATEHLLSLGRRRLAFVGGVTEDYPEFRLRYQGHLAALEAAGLRADPRLQHTARSEEADGEAAVAHWARKRLAYDGVVCASDLIALGVMRGLQQRGRRVPQDVAVVGFDDVAFASHVSPPLTTVRQDTRAAGERLVDNLIRLIEGEPVSSQLIAPQLMVRQSCGGRPPAG